MTKPHKATHEHWAFLRRWAADGGNTATALVELRARVEALEAGATCPHIVSGDEGTSYCALAEQHQDKLDRLIEQDRAASAEARPADGGLVEQVAKAINRVSPWRHENQARAAIREVAAWLRDRGGYPWAWAAQTLEQEADR